MIEKNPSSVQISERELNQILLLVETSHGHVRKLIELNGTVVDCVIDLVAGSSLTSSPRSRVDAAYRKATLPEDCLF